MGDAWSKWESRMNSGVTTLSLLPLESLTLFSLLFYYSIFRFSYMVSIFLIAFFSGGYISFKSIYFCSFELYFETYGRKFYCKESN